MCIVQKIKRSILTSILWVHAYRMSKWLYFDLAYDEAQKEELGM